MFAPYADEIIGQYQCRIRCKISTTNQIFCIRQVLEKKLEYNRTVHQLFVDSEKAYEPVRREILSNILIEFGIPMKLVSLIKMYLKEVYSKVRTDKNVSDVFPIQNGVKQDALLPLLLNFDLENDMPLGKAKKIRKDWT
jgi:hypothetical protein